NHLNTAAFNTGQLIAGGDLDAAVAEDHLLDAAGAVGLPMDEAILTIRSGFSAGESCPRTTTRQILDRTEALRQVARVAEAADACAWSGHRGKRCYRTLFGAIAVAHELGGPVDLPLSTNRVMVAANTRSRGQTWRALGELTEDRWL